MREIIEYFETLLYRRMGSVRFTQNSPIMPDVWLMCARQFDEPHDLLLVPDASSTPAVLAQQLRERFREHRKGGRIWSGYDESDRGGRPEIAYNESSVVAKLWFREIVQIALPLSNWWTNYLFGGKGQTVAQRFVDDRERLADDLSDALRALDEGVSAEGSEIPTELVWLSLVAGSLVTLESLSQDRAAKSDAQLLESLRSFKREAADAGHRNPIVDTLFEVLAYALPKGDSPICLWTVNRNRISEQTVYRSTSTVKADAVQTLFDVRGKEICWAVIDSGVDASHFAFRQRSDDGLPLGPLQKNKPSSIERFDGSGNPLVRNSKGQFAVLKDKPAKSAFRCAFVREDDERNKRTRRIVKGRWINQTRIVKTFDFTRMRRLLNAETVDELPEELRGKKSAAAILADVQKALKSGRMIPWELLEPLLEIQHSDEESYIPPEHHHGTHVAGILGADWRAEENGLSPVADRCGVAPDIAIYDLRALGPKGTGDEFSLLSALQYVRSLNSRHNRMRIHGVNLSFSIRHEVANYACGRTPVCEEAERLVGSGVFVVAAAGNSGRARYLTTDDRIEEGFRNASITDPGNAEAAMTVGATHRLEPHSYGVSYFSSRGPTGDGRLKPDIVAPGEKIYSTVPRNGERELDGTSMAAPHVSGAAALLMQRNFEFVGQPAKVKKVLCDSATDLGRERYYQGAGMLDILRALQSV